MAFSGFLDNDRYIRTDKPINIVGDTFADGVYVDGRYDYQPLEVVDRLDETTQLSTTEFVSNHSKRRYDVKNSALLVENRYYTLTINADITITLPTPKDTNVNNEIMVTYVYQAGAVNLGTDLFLDGIVPAINSATPRGTIYYDYDPNLNKWFCGVVSG